MEFTAGSYQSPDPYHGGDGYRPTINAYQYGDARALALLKRKAGDTTAAQRYFHLDAPSTASSSIPRSPPTACEWSPPARSGSPPCRCGGSPIRV